MHKIIVLILFSFSAFSQQILSLADVQALALENNFQLKTADKDIEIAVNQISKANAGFSPTIDWNVNFGSVFNQVNQRFVDGREINRFGRSLSPNTAVQLQYTIYDGKRSRAVYGRLENEGQMAQLQKKIAIENVVQEAFRVFFELQRLQKINGFLQTNKKYYEERVRITDERWQIGRGTKLDFLQTKADLNSQESSLNGTMGALDQAKVSLSKICGKDLGRLFALNESDKINIFSSREEALKNLVEKNLNLRLTDLMMQNNSWTLNERKSFKAPRITLNSSFGYNFNNNNAGLITYNQNVGLNNFISASFRLFDGGLVNRNIQQVKLQSESIKIEKNRLQFDLENAIQSAFINYENQIRLIALEKANIEIAEENLNISNEKFKLGASTILEINDAQTRFNEAKNRLINAEFNLNLAALDILYLSGNLVN